jgi:hypothetical protein
MIMVCSVVFLCAAAPLLALSRDDAAHPSAAAEYPRRTPYRQVRGQEIRAALIDENPADVNTGPHDLSVASPNAAADALMPRPVAGRLKPVCATYRFNPVFDRVKMLN